MASDLVFEFTEANYKTEVLDCDLPVLVDFWAEWCGPCKMLIPTIDEIAAETEGKLKVGKVNIDEAGGLAQQYGIQSIPTILLIIKGEVKESIVGALPKAQIIEKLSAHI